MIAHPACCPHYPCEWQLFGGNLAKPDRLKTIPFRNLLQPVVFRDAEVPPISVYDQDGVVSERPSYNRSTNMIPRRYVLRTLASCIIIFAFLTGFGLIIDGEKLNKIPLTVIGYTMLATIAIGWISMIITLDSLIAGPYLRTLSEEQMVKLNIPMMLVWSECFDHIYEQEEDRDS